MADETLEALRDDAEPTNENFVALRNALKAKDRELKELRAFKSSTEPQLRTFALKDAGFDPESPQAKALLKLHDGEFTPEAIKATAGEYGFVAGEAGTTADPGQQLDEAQQGALEASQRGQQLNGASSSTTPPQTTDARLKAAEQKGRDTGDWSEFDQLQAALI